MRDEDKTKAQLLHELVILRQKLQECKSRRHECKRSEEELQRANLELEFELTQRIEEEKETFEQQLRHSQKMEAIGTLAGGIAHDFNNILTTIVASASLMQRHVREDDPLRRHLDRIFAAAERASSLTKGLLAYSRKSVNKTVPVKLNAIVDNIHKLFVRLIPENIEFTCALTDEELTIMGDSGQIEQIMMNLITNARDAMPEGGELTIRTGSIVVDQEFVAVRGLGTPGRYAVLSVADSGVGMDAKTRERIFEPFFTTKEVGKGTGLGLSMVYGIVRQHGGFINVSSETGHGTVFEVYFPVTDSDVRESADRAIDLPKVAERTILVVEDDNLVRQILTDVLSSSGYRVIEAVDGEDGIAKFLEHRDEVHLLISDIMMPKKSGIETYREIRKIRDDIKVIFISGYSSAATKEILAEGLTYMAKPVSPRALLAKIREVLTQ